MIWSCWLWVDHFGQTVTWSGCRREWHLCCLWPGLTSYHVQTVWWSVSQLRLGCIVRTVAGSVSLATTLMMLLTQTAKDYLVKVCWKLSIICIYLIWIGFKWFGKYFQRNTFPLFCLIWCYNLIFEWFVW